MQNIFSLLLIVVVVCAVHTSAKDATTYTPPCDMNDRFNSCSDGKCCAMDDFLPKYVKCKKIGYWNDTCSTRSSGFDCPCHKDFRCTPNIVGSHVSTVYGTCKPIPGASTITNSTNMTSGNLANVTTPENSANVSTAPTVNPVSHYLDSGNDSITTVSSTGPHKQACSMNDQIGSCPASFCCTKDDAHPETKPFCKRLGNSGDPCSTQPASLECPCEKTYRCVPVNTTGMYGTCQIADGVAVG